MQCDLPLEEKQLNCKIVLYAVTKSLKRIPKIRSYINITEMRDFLIENVSNIYYLLKMDDLEVFRITKSCFKMNYLTVVGPQVPPFPH